MSAGKWARLLWVSAVVPPVAALAWTVAMAASVPEPEQWRIRFKDGPPCLAWEHILDFEEHPATPGFRLIHLGLLSLPGIDVQHVPGFTWGLTLAVWLGLLALVARSAGPGRSRFLLPAAALLLGLRCFSPAFGVDWLIGERFRFAVPPAGFVAALLVLGRWRAWPVAFWVAAGIMLMAAFTAPGAAAVWVALLPVVAIEARWRADPHRAFHLGAWCLLGNLAVAAVRPTAWPSHGTAAGIVEGLMEHPAEALRFVVRSLAWGMPDLLRLSSRDELWGGGALLLAAAVLAGILLARRREDGLVRRAVPWASCGLMGVGMAVVAWERFYPPLLDDIVLRKGTCGILLLPVGVVGMAGVLCPRAFRLLFPPAALLLAVLLVRDWRAGRSQLLLERGLLRQGEAWVLLPTREGTALGGAPVTAPYPWTLSGMKQRGLMRGLEPFDSLVLAGLPVESGAGKAGRLEAIEGAIARGWVRAGGLPGGADIVLLARRPPGGEEVVFRAVAPDLLADPERPPFAGELAAEEETFREGVVIRAFGLDGGARRLVPLEGVFRRAGGRFVAVPESRR